MKLQTIIFISPSGAGKGTQTDELIKYIESKDDRRVFHMQSGKAIRNFLEDSSYGSKLAGEISPKGGLQPAFLAIWAWAGELIRKLDKDEHLIIDGAPRKLIEIEPMEEAMEFFNRENIKVVYLNVSRDWSILRLTERGRGDDKDMSSIEKRLAWFETDVKPVIEYYKNSDKYDFHEVNGEQSIEDVHGDIVRALGL